MTTRIFIVKLVRSPYFMVATKRPKVSKIENTVFNDSMNQLTELVRLSNHVTFVSYATPGHIINVTVKTKSNA